MLTQAIRPCQRTQPTANSLQADAPCKFAGTSHSQALSSIEKILL